MTTQKDSVLERYQKLDDQCYKHYISLFPEDKHTTIWDGVIFPEEYADAPLKVMILNREGYTEDGNDYAVNEALRIAIENDERIFPNQTTLRTHLKQYLSVLDLIGLEDLPDLSDEKVSEKVSKEATDEFQFNLNMKSVAYCNIKKSDGQPQSNKQNLKDYAKKGLDILKEQISFFNPSIILAGDVCEGILDDLVEWGENLFNDPNGRIGIWQLKIADKLYPFVDMYHPSRTQGMSEYYLELFHALQSVEKERPGFFVEQLCKDCFIGADKHPNQQQASSKIKQQPKQESESEAESLYLKGKTAAEQENWHLAVKYYQQAADKGFAAAYRALADFSQKIYYGRELFRLDDWDDFNIDEEEYYNKAAELGDEQAQFQFIEDNLSFLIKSNRIAGTLGRAKLNIFKMNKISTNYKIMAEKAVDYFNNLLRKGYKPAVEKLHNIKALAEQNVGNWPEILPYIDIPNNLK